ncbi:retrovirus-related Pol polyprotein from type-1 retrotransposable element R2 [Trichonephila clavata]|uniref:Retrovirus-related Pol polyprotein from type-1 retrotransposable element R2 n=1 Tax=Trichonephila clavata TaxID=2740835 RepID=A0A8X6GQ59_TRICU|nr:retrovirus-related Pol polyprotein from type-1 retrotransposable element R2 [Trichonephila clavata]
MQRVHQIPRQNKPLRSVSSPPKNGRWCPACVGYVFDDLSKAAHDGLHHPKVITAPPQQSTLPFPCPECSFRGVSKKAVFYHRRQVHPKAGPSSRVPEPPHSPIESVSASPPQPTPIDLVQPQTQGGLSFVGSELIVKFPIDPLFSCPIKGCRFQSKTKTWYATNHSLKRHLLITHKKRDLSVRFLCSFCNEPINRKPSSHPCLKASGLILKQSNPVTAWDCQECGETFPTKVGLDNHCLAHKKNAIKIKDVPVVVPPPTKAKRVARKERIRKHAVGTPALAPLSGLPQNTVTDSPPPPGDIPLPLIDIQENMLLSTFVEPLNALLTHDDLPGAVDDFFGITQDLVSVVQQHFRIRTNLNNREGIPPRRKELDMLDPQAVQRCYGWNRRKFIRQLTGDNSERCRIAKADIVSHFTTTWGSPLESPDLPACDPPERPPVVHAFTPTFVASCLQSAENSAPGPDGIMYKQWREVDPGCKIVSAIFNICLKLNKIPPSWKSSSTVLIHKNGEHDDITNWRPIALSNTLYKLFTKCLTRKLADWCETHEVFSNSQKGFTPYDGVVEHNFLLSQHFETARAGHSDSLAAWIDISNAFGSVPHGPGPGASTTISSHWLKISTKIQPHRS